jgi:hypothetical protein
MARTSRTLARTRKRMKETAPDCFGARMRRQLRPCNRTRSAMSRHSLRRGLRPETRQLISRERYYVHEPLARQSTGTPRLAGYSSSTLSSTAAASKRVAISMKGLPDRLLGHESGEQPTLGGLLALECCVPRNCASTRGSRSRAIIF